MNDRIGRPSSVSRKRILFVDDDAAVLGALKAVFHRERKRWDMVFVTGGGEALEEFRKQPFDVIVSDMRIPPSMARRS